jgi:hypothetical protein
VAACACVCARDGSLQPLSCPEILIQQQVARDASNNNDTTIRMQLATSCMCSLGGFANFTSVQLVTFHNLFESAVALWRDACGSIKRRLQQTLASNGQGRFGDTAQFLMQVQYAPVISSQQAPMRVSVRGAPKRATSTMHAHLATSRCVDRRTGGRCKGRRRARLCLWNSWHKHGHRAQLWSGPEGLKAVAL